jgi:serine/threonine-protein kinase/endoribonuclease IRE1
LIKEHPSIIMEIVKQIVEGLRALHKLKVVHRDIKPSNILIRLEEQRSGNPKISIKLIDFSISKVISDRGVAFLSDLFSTG